MNFRSKISELRLNIENALSPIITDKVILVDAPYYDNIGDVLIWQGIIEFLSAQGKTLIACSSGMTFPYSEISEDVTILLMGGGNFGDLWRWFQNIRLKVIQQYPNNRIVMFPQSVWYEDESLISEDARILAQHKDLYLCARDQWSYDFLNHHFSANNVLLVPDMAFYINDKILEPYRGKESGRKLFFRRLDKEITDDTPVFISNEYDIHDWPTVEHKPQRFYFVGKAYGAVRRLHNKPLVRFTNHCIDLFANRFIKDALVKIGCKFLSQYSSVTTTRLHAMILSVLLHKPVEYIDNSTKKLSAFAQTWLNDLKEVRPYE
ncbi:MAG: polysaccharide pyruvyl transferase family protein [Muribaculaceae bacterium]|nr:polysaccharide pyruvyl transferase family protein [Muribaculaceae bacterium]